MSLGLLPAILSIARRVLTKVLRLDTDYTTGRASNLDNLDAPISVVDTNVDTINSNVDATVSSRLADSDAVARTQTGLTSQGYTTGRAPNLDNLDSTVSSRLADADAVARVQTGLTNQGYTTGRADHLDVLAGVVGSDNDNLFGDGRDGSNTLTTLATRHKIIQHVDFTINSGGIVRPASGTHLLVIMVSGTLTVNSGGIIDADGFGSVGGSSAGVPNPGTDGVMSKDGNIGFVPQIGGRTITNRDGEDGGGDPRQVFPLSIIDDTLLFVKGAGGGSGPSLGAGQNGGDGGDVWSGGGKGAQNQFVSVNGLTGGTGGGSVIIFANNIVVNSGGRISARGLPPAAINQAGGPGGGGGGLVYLVYRSLTNSGAIDAAGGAGGGTTNPLNGDGGNGSAGVVVTRHVPD